MNKLTTIKVRVSSRTCLRLLSQINGETQVDYLDKLLNKEFKKQKFEDWEAVKKKIDKKFKIKNSL